MKSLTTVWFSIVYILHVAAQTSNTVDSLNHVEMPAVTVIAKKDLLLSDVPGSVAYIRPVEMKRMTPLSGNEVFRKIAGVNVVDEEGLGLRANIGIRGLDPDRSANVLVLEDGIPVQLNPYGEPELYYSPSIDRMAAVELLKGSGQIMFGPRTIGGVVNYITADPPSERETSVTLRGGSSGFLGLQLGYGNTFGNAGMRVHYLHKRADKIGVTGFEIHDLNAKFRLMLSEKSSLGIKLQVYDELSNATYIGLTQPMFDREEYYPVMAPDDQLRVRRYALGTTHKYLISKNLKLISTAYLYTTDRNWRRQAFSSSPTAPKQTGVVWGDPSIDKGAIFMQYETLNRNRSFLVGGAETHLVWNYNLGNSKSQLDAGARVIRETAAEQEILGSSPASRSGALVKDEKRPGYALSSFVQNKFALGQHFSITAGLRMEYYHFERGLYLYKASATTYRDTAIVAATEVSALIPGLGANYALGKNVALFAGLHKGFAPPAIKNSVSTAGEVFPLDAQESWNYELGARFTTAKGIEGEATLFMLDFAKQVIPVSESSGGSGSGFANAGKTLHQGAEASLKIDFGKLLQWKYQLYYQGSGTYSKATYAADRFVGTERSNVRGNTLPYAPSWTSSHTLGLVTPWRLDMQFSGSYVSRQFTNELNTETASADGRTGEIPAYFVADAALRLAVPKWKSTFFCTVKNLGDARYIASRRPQGIKVGTPRLIVVGVESVF
jgi:Fe(3+) dicitrate transport protein